MGKAKKLIQPKVVEPVGFFEKYNQYIYMGVALVGFIMILNMLRPQPPPPEKKKESSWGDSLWTLMAVGVVIAIIVFFYRNNKSKNPAVQNNENLYSSSLDDRFSDMQESYKELKTLIENNRDYMDEHFGQLRNAIKGRTDPSSSSSIMVQNST